MSKDGQSELGDHDPTKQTIAEELADEKQQASIAEFFGKNKQMLGFDSPPRALVTAIKEAVDNSLDACEEAGILPDIYVNIERTEDYYRVTVEDNGPGITKEEIPKVFGQLLYGSRFHTREMSRGQQGIGISAAVLYSQRTTGKPATITSRTQGGNDANRYELIIDEENNEADIRDEDTVEWDKEHGTRITLEMEANLRARNQLHDYIRYTAVVNPHARVEFHEPDADLVYERSSDQLPPETEEIKPHPHGVELGTLIQMLRDSDEDDLAEFLQEEFVRVGRKGAEKILRNFRANNYGRQMPWPANGGLDGTLEIDGVDPETADAFLDEVADRLDDADRITHADLQNIVDAAADATERESGVRIGDPVAADAPTAWAEVSDDGDGAATLDDWSDDPGTGPLGRAIGKAATRKSDAALRVVTDEVTAAVVDATRLNREDVGEIVADAADTAEDATDETFGKKARSSVADAVWNEIDDGTDLSDVRERVVAALWPAATTRRAALLHQWLDDITAVQKDDDAVEQFAEELAERFTATGAPEHVTHSRLDDIVDDAADTTERETDERFGDTSREKILDHIWEEMTPVEGHIPSVNEIADDRDACQSLIEGMREAKIIAPPTDCLAPIGADELETGLKTVFEGAALYSTETRDADVYSGDPFIVEAGIAYGGDIFTDEDRRADDKARVLRFANRVPLVYQRGACSTVDVIKDINWRNYFTGSNSLNQTGGTGIPHGPLVLVVHVASTNVPFTSESKDAVANVEIIEQEVERALRECARDLKSHLKAEEEMEKRRTKKRVVGNVLPKIADKAASVVDTEPADTTESMARIMNSVMLRPFPDDEDKVHIENYSNNGESFTVRLHFDDKPTYPSQNVEREETDDGWALVWESRLESGETDTITWNEAGKPTITYDDIEMEKVSTTDRSPIATN